VQGIRPIDFDKDERAVYRQIADQIRELIRVGHFKPGKPIPPEVEMMKVYGCARGTVRQARALLEREGWIETKHGKGSFVTASPPSSR
jgi:DNA-binding GntR family transcriptional regulator